MSDWNTVPTLRGRHVHIDPMTRADTDGLRAAAADGALWTLWYTSVPAPEATDAYVAAALEYQARGRDFALVVRDNSDVIVGSTRLCNLDRDNCRLEIGYTWYAQRVQRSAVNTETKRLLLTHAFETLGCIAVEFRTHWFNHRSRAAILRLGAKQDGVLRNHQRLADGSFRDTVVFSIIESEWPAVRRHLDTRLAAGASE